MNFYSDTGHTLRLYTAIAIAFAAHAGYFWYATHEKPVVTVTPEPFAAPTMVSVHLLAPAPPEPVPEPSAEPLKPELPTEKILPEPATDNAASEPAPPTAEATPEPPPTPAITPVALRKPPPPPKPRKPKPAPKKTKPTYIPPVKAPPIPRAPPPQPIQPVRPVTPAAPAVTPKTVQPPAPRAIPVVNAASVVGRRHPPVYPKRALRMRQQGTVWLRVLISDTGKQLHIELRKPSPYPLLNRAAVEAVKKWTFTPYKINGKAVKSRVDIPIEFNMR